MDAAKLGTVPRSMSCPPPLVPQVDAKPGRPGLQSQDSAGMETKQLSQPGTAELMLPALQSSIAQDTLKAIRLQYATWGNQIIPAWGDHIYLRLPMRPHLLLPAGTEHAHLYHSLHVAMHSMSTVVLSWLIDCQDEYDTI